MAAEGGNFLIEAATYLGAAAIAVPIFNRFKLGSILGYLFAGVIVGPSGLNLLRQEEGVFHIAELGVVLFLFVIGLELSLTRLWSLRKDIFGLGAAQMVVTGALIAGIFVSVDVMPVSAAIVAGMSLAFSSTAFALQFMKDRGELNSPYGNRAFPVLLFQDLAVIPLLAAIPFLAGSYTGGEEAHSMAGWVNAGKALGVIVALVLIGRFALNTIFRMVANSGSREAFAAMALFVVAAVSLAVSWAGLSMALGAFLAGALLAESSYRHQIETDIEPFRGLLLGLFFISIGMRLNLDAIVANWLIVICGAAGLVAIKAMVLFGLARVFGAAHGDALKTGAILSQGGEFAFVVFSLGLASALFTNNQVTLMSAIVTLSMVATPFMMMAARALSQTVISEDGDDMEGPHGDKDHVIVAGFGRMGQIISQVLGNSGVTITAIDNNPGHIRNAERFGFKVYFGDASRLDTLVTAGALDAKAVILCMDDVTAVNHALAALRERSKTVFIAVCAHDRLHEIDVRPLGADLVIRETLESSILLARETLSRVGFDDNEIDDYVQEFRERDRQRLLAQIDEGRFAGADLLYKDFTRSAPK